VCFRLMVGKFGLMAGSQDELMKKSSCHLIDSVPRSSPVSPCLHDAFLRLLRPAMVLNLSRWRNSLANLAQVMGRFERADVGVVSCET